MSTRTNLALLLLTAGAASTDALSYLGLGQVFPANMTGNTVLLAVGTASSDYSAAVRSALALAGFVVGAVLAGLVIEGRPLGIWTPPMRIVLLAELAVLLAVLGWWLTLAAKPGGASRLALIGLLGLTMGAQSGAVTRLPVGVSTTYITGTWTGVSNWVAARVRRTGRAEDRSTPGLQAAVLVCYLGAAFGGGYLFTAVGPAAAAIAPGAVLAAMATASRGSPRRRIAGGVDEQPRLEAAELDEAAHPRRDVRQDQ